MLLLDTVSHVSVATANRSLRCRFARCLVRLFAQRVELLERGGFLFCQMFMQHGGFEVKVKCGQLDRLWNPKIRAAQFPVHFLETPQFLDGLVPLFALIDCAPNFVGALLCELLARLQRPRLGRDSSSQLDASWEPLLVRIRDDLAHRICDWQAWLYEDGGRRRLDGVHARVASVICAVPVKEAVSCGLAEWFIGLARKSIVDPVCSSTDLFLRVLEQHKGRRNICMEFVHILATVGHCGFTTDTIRRIFEACITAIIGWSDNVSIHAYDCGVTLDEVLSAVAKMPGQLWQGRGKHYCFTGVMDKAREYDMHYLEHEDSWDQYTMIEQILLNGRVAALPRSGLDLDDLEFLDFYRDLLLGRSLRNAGEHVVLQHDAVWNAQIVRACLTMEPSRVSAFAVELGARVTEVDQKKKAGWIDAFLSGITQALEENADTITILARPSQDRGGQSCVVFSDDDSRELRDICLLYPYILSTLERFESRILSLRDG